MNAIGDNKIAACGETLGRHFLSTLDLEEGRVKRSVAIDEKPANMTFFRMNGGPDEQAQFLALAFG